MTSPATGLAAAHAAWCSTTTLRKLAWTAISLHLRAGRRAEAVGGALRPHLYGRVPDEHDGEHLPDSRLHGLHPQRLAHHPPLRRSLRPADGQTGATQRSAARHAGICSADGGVVESLDTNNSYDLSLTDTRMLQPVLDEMRLFTDALIEERNSCQNDAESLSCSIITNSIPSTNSTSIPAVTPSTSTIMPTTSPTTA